MNRILSDEHGNAIGENTASTKTNTEQIDAMDDQLKELNMNQSIFIICMLCKKSENYLGDKNS